MKLYDLKFGPNPRRVRIFMAEKGITVERVPVDTKGGENLTEPFLEKNRFGKVPVLELDDGTCISESVAICRYFEEMQPDPLLFGKTAMERVQVEMWQRRLELNLLLVISAAFRNLTGFFADRERVVQEWGEVSRERAKSVYPILDEHLGTRRYLAGQDFSIADITGLCAIDSGKKIDLFFKEDQKNLSRWYEEVSSRPSAVQ